MGTSALKNEAALALKQLWEERYQTALADLQQQLRREGDYYRTEDYLLREEDIEVFSRHAAYEDLKDHFTGAYVRQHDLPTDFANQFRESVTREYHAFRYRRFVEILEKGALSYRVVSNPHLTTADRVAFTDALSQAVDEWNAYLQFSFVEVTGPSDLVVTFAEFDADYTEKYTLGAGTTCMAADTVARYANATLLFAPDGVNKIVVYPAFFDLNNKFNRTGILRHELGHILGLLHTCHLRDAPSAVGCGLYRPDNGKAYFASTDQPYSDRSVMKNPTECCYFKDFDLLIDPIYDGAFIYQQLSPGF